MQDAGHMKRLAVFAALLLFACENPSKLDTARRTRAEGGGGSEGGVSSEALSQIESRLAALEAAHKPGAHDGSTGDPIAERLHKLETTLARREEALAFLDMAWAQQKRQMEQQEANEPDPNAVFAVDISKAVAAGQTEGPANALVTIVEAWDFA